MTIRPFDPAEAEQLARLFEAMQTHYGVPCPPRAAIVADLRQLPPGNRILVAEAEGVLAGFAAFTEVWPGPGLRKGLFLKELYVDAAHRGRGLGSGLVTALAALALSEGHSRVDWTADRSNPALLAFYDATGARRESGKLYYRLTGEALARFAGWES
ncbi:acetyltransferase [Azospirillum sp. TSH100]|uniref:GNAT family N-acetyltransferase n=1 Tax=Azospirillum sp. TSH100 TaxID=652764 RepID=UPI000D619809|nr:GNAT family N-acetyltransferase [Azospirillum sp. TSH100]PWC91344.1 acetyltransferase [Azospirillum sp. TSH100]QCG89234.1 GNAT family N-acetyltransferase [Azospirillum sp. TSH100]